MEAFTLYPDGEPMVLVDPSCRMLIEGFRSKYRYLKQRGFDDKYSNKPEKNKWSHIMEAAQYGAVFALNKYDVADHMIYREGSIDKFFAGHKAYAPADSYTGY